MRGVSYKKLWHLLLDRDMTKKDLYTKAGVGNSTITKLGNDESVTVSILEKICNALECDFNDIMEMVEKKP